jgi:hypothetical protein
MELTLKTEPETDEDWKVQYPFLEDYQLGDIFLLENASFHISSKCYSLHHRLRGRPELQFALGHIDPLQWFFQAHHTFYDKLVDIDFRIEFLKAVRQRVLCWMKDNNRIAFGPFWWMESINQVASEQVSQWDNFIDGWKNTRSNLIGKQQRKRILEFTTLLRLKFKQYNFNEHIILFKIIRYLFDFHPDNQCRLYCLDAYKKISLKRKLIN